MSNGITELVNREQGPTKKNKQFVYCRTKYAT
jgi:hypothetical protein